MLDFLKGILGRKEPETLDLAFDGIPAWVASLEEAAKKNLVEATEEPVRNIRNAAAGLQLVVNNISGAEDDPVLHPKVRTVAKNSLPLFVRTMNVSLAKELPEDREEFYTAAVECVRSCLNSARGQGRYLQVVFPDEMKTVKTGIDAMGREINAMTKALADYRTVTGLSAEVRALHGTVAGMKEDLARSIEKDARSDTRIAEISSRIEAIGRELAALAADERMHETEEMKSALADAERARDDAARHYASLSMTSSHVFRKAEKIASKQHHSPESAALRQVMDLLSGHAVPGQEELASALQLACPVAVRMIGSGEIALKNKEERSVFSDSGRFCTEICEAAAGVVAREAAWTQAAERLASHPLLTRIHSLEREREQQLAMREREEQVKREREEWRKGTEEKIPAAIRELGEKAALLAGNGTLVRLTGA